VEYATVHHVTQSFDEHACQCHKASKCTPRDDAKGIIIANKGAVESKS